MNSFHWVRFFGLLAAAIGLLVFGWGMGELTKWMDRKKVSPLWLIAVLVIIASALISSI